MFRALLLLSVPFLIAGLAEEPQAFRAPVPAAAPVTETLAEEATPSSHPGAIINAFQAFKTNLWSLITQKQYQCIVAVFALQLGLIALYDGRSFFKVLVVICVGSVAFCMVLSQLRTTWTEGESTVMKYVASLEVGLFMAMVSYKGWEGTQLLLGLVVGLYLFHNVQAAAFMVPQLQDFAQHSIWKVIVASLMVAVGSWMVHDKYGAARVLGVLAPLFGSTLLVATAEYALVLLCTLPGPGKALNCPVSPSAVPSVFEFWYMIAFPMHSEAVGYFKLANKNLVLGGQPIEVDRALGIFFSLVIFAVAANAQLKAARQANAALTAPLLAEENSVPKTV